MLFNKKKCVEETQGTIIKVRYNDSDSRRLKVEYRVNERIYYVSENITVKSLPIKVGGLVVGQRKEEYITQGIGEHVKVCYNPEKPKCAFLKDNNGKYL